MEKRDASDEASVATSKESETLDSVFDNVDHSLIQQPLQTGIQNILQILKCMKHGTTEVRHLILRGCNIIYECKICNSLYRSLANFLLHKRFYCKKEILESKKADDSQVVIPSSSSEQLNTLNGNHKIENDIKENNPSTDLTSDTHNSIKCEHNELSEDNSIGNVVTNTSLEGDASINNQIEPTKTDTVDIKDINPSCNSANITSFYNTNSRAKRLSRRTDCNLSSLMCLKCNTKYTSMKTLYFHMITIHSAKRQYYPCPYCDNSFVQMWGVTRHLTQVHNKTKKQVNRLKETVRRNAFVKREYSVSKHSRNAKGRNQSYFSHNRNRYHKRNAGFSRRSSNLNRGKNHGVESKESHKRMGANAPVKLTSSSVIEKKVKGMIDAKKLVCLKCRRKFSTFSNLRRHAAIHAGWTRYMCQRCCYQSYNRSDCRTHIQRIHAYPGMHDLDKFIVSLPSVKISVTKGESLNNRPVKFKKKCKKTEGTSLNSEKDTKNGDMFERPIKWNGFTYSDNHMESLVTRSRKYPKVQTYNNNTATRLYNEQGDLNVESKKEMDVEAENTQFLK